MKNLSKLVMGILLTAVACFSELPSGMGYEKFYDTGKLDFGSLIWAGEIPGRPGDFLLSEIKGNIFALIKTGEGYEKKEVQTIETWTNGSVTNGFYNIEFHPNYLENHRIFLAFRNPDGGESYELEEWSLDPQTLEMEKTKTIMSEPRSTGTYGQHSAVYLKFGPDGYLYLSISDHNEDAQDMGHTFGKFLRIDINNTDPGRNYAIPSDNPFVSQEGARGEIWAVGFRAPWKFDFDTKTGEIWSGDVGGGGEEVNLVAKGENYLHGAKDNNGKTPSHGPCDPDRFDCAKFQDPVLYSGDSELPYFESRCVITGQVYRENSQSAFYGKYIFIDNSNHRVYGYDPETKKAEILVSLLPEFGSKTSGISGTPGLVNLFSDSQGNYYVVKLGKGRRDPGHVYKLTHPEFLSPEPTFLKEKYGTTKSQTKLVPKIQVSPLGTGSSGLFYKVNGKLISIMENK